MTAINRLSLTNFRSYTDALIAPGTGLVILTGENGAGKTNMLEAVSLLSPGRGLRGASLSEMARNSGPGGFAVSAELVLPGQDGDVSIGTGTLASAPERRQVRINGASASATSLAEWLSVLWLTPAMDRLFQEGASGRRRFLDRLVLALSPAHAVHASRYEAAMRARNKLLADEAPDRDWLSALEARMAEHGAAMIEAREIAIAALSERLAEAPESPFARPALRLDGGAEDLGSLSRSRARDAAAGRTLIGPHRTDLSVTHIGKNQAASLCSTGEQKALLLSIVLAHADLVADRSGRGPILLLDEVAAHLDPSRRAALFERLGAGGGQVWMTGTEPSLFEAIAGGATWFEVAEGQLQSV
jgi:DNA replication and repair protein RecF